MKKPIPFLIHELGKLVRYLGLSPESNPLNFPLSGDVCIHYAFVIKNLLDLNKDTHKLVLDVGCCNSPLTTIIKELGFTVDGIDLRPSSLSYHGVNYIQDNFLSADFRVPYDIIVMSSVIQHVGLKGRYNSPEIKDGDIKTLEKAKQILNPGGILVLTLPYGKEKTIKPLHRVYNKNSKLLKYAYNEFDSLVGEFYKNNSENIWVKCGEDDARKVTPLKDNFALGLFVFRKN